jgi:hypothetical protein
VSAGTLMTQSELERTEMYQAYSRPNGGVAICDLDMPPTAQGSEHHEQVHGTVALILILIVMPRRLAWLQRLFQPKGAPAPAPARSS